MTEAENCTQCMTVECDEIGPDDMLCLSIALFKVPSLASVTYAAASATETVFT